jgi:hypothetical protein
MIIGRNFAEKLYSANEYYEDEKLYSTGDDYLDDLLEKAFCDGYEYAQREFTKPVDDPLLKKQILKTVSKMKKNSPKTHDEVLKAYRNLPKSIRRNSKGSIDNLEEMVANTKDGRFNEYLKNVKYILNK